MLVFVLLVEMKCGTLVFCLISRLVVSVFATSVEDEVQTLKAQVNALLQRRQEDYNQLEESLKKTLNKHDEITNLKNEIRDLRTELEALRSQQSASYTSSNRDKNEQLTVQWLASSISEIRSEISEMFHSFNSTVELQQQQSLNTDISTLQNDVVTLRHDFESFKGEFAKAVAKVASLSQDVEVSRQLSHNTAAITSNLTDKLHAAVLDWSINVKTMQRQHQQLQQKNKVFKRMVVVNEDPLDLKVLTTASGNGRYRRHNRGLVKQILQIKENLRDLQLSYKYLKHQLGNLEEQLPMAGGETETRLRGEFEPRFSKLEVLGESLNDSVAFLSTQINGQEKLHTSMLELLESVENIENKVDSTTPDLKREISKLEFSLAQITSTTSLLKEDQDNQRMSVKALGEGLSSIQDKIANYQSEIANLSSRVTNTLSPSQLIKSQHTKENGTTEFCSPNLNIESAFRKLSAIHNQYSSIVNQLPKDCSLVNGASGLYLLSPDDEVPMLVYCKLPSQADKNTYTVIQRRINGIQDFNKNWQEYAHGFGNPSGEFWLGNEAIHRLTKKNDTKLRIDFKDILGKFWFAEYSEFSVASREEGYKLHVAGYSGNASDALEYQNRMQFSTVDSDRDISNTNCAANYEGGWWFSHCQHTNLNGKYNLGLTWFDKSHNEWIAVAFTEMKLLKKITV